MLLIASDESVIKTLILNRVLLSSDTFWRNILPAAESFQEVAEISFTKVSNTEWGGGERKPAENIFFNNGEPKILFSETPLSNNNRTI